MNRFISFARLLIVVSLSLVGCAAPTNNAAGSRVEILDLDGSLPFPDGYGAGTSNTFSVTGPTTWTLDVSPVADSNHPGRGSTVHVEVWGAGGGGAGGGNANSAGGFGGGGGGAGGYLRYDYTIPTSGVSMLRGSNGAAGAGGAQPAMYGGFGGASEFRVVQTGGPSAGSLVLRAGGGGGGSNAGSGPGAAGAGGSNTVNAPPAGILTVVSNVPGASGGTGYLGETCSAGEGGAGGSGVTNTGDGGHGGRGGYYRHFALPSCLAHRYNWHIENGAAGLPGRIRITW